MKQQRVVRLFVSSTFQDFVVERQLLHERVFPKLRAHCAYYGMRFEEIDLRWGVPAEAAQEQHTMSICLDELRRCQTITPRPNFLVLIGGRYGWEPLPEQIETDEMKRVLQNAVSNKARHHIRKWYRIDNNALPAVWLLQPRRGLSGDEWANTENELRCQLRAAAKRAQLARDSETWIQISTSATHQEILKGALQPEFASQAIVFVRSIPNRRRSQKLQALVDVLKNTIPAEHFVEYQGIGAIDEDASPSDKEQFVNDMVTALTRSVTDLCSEAQCQPQQENQAHREFGAALTCSFVGREDALRTIAACLDGEDSRPMLVTDTGEMSTTGGGTGKSTLMAKAAGFALARHAEILVFERYLGATPDSAGLTAVLEGLAREIALSVGFDPSHLTNRAELWGAQPTTKAALLFRRALQKIEETGRKAAIFIDGLDLIDASPRGEWIPSQLPHGVHLVVSARYSTAKQFMNRCVVLTLAGMSLEEGKELLGLWLNNSQRRLQPNQYEVLLNAFRDSGGLPLYLKLAYEKARQWTSYAILEKLPTTTHEIIDILFKHLEHSHGCELTSSVIGLLAASRHGLNEDEIRNAIAHNPAMWERYVKENQHQEALRNLRRLPAAPWARLYHELKPYLTNHDDGVLDFFHREFYNAAKTRYLDANPTLFHETLADFFHSQPMWLDTRQTIPNARKVTELPRQQAKAEKPWSDLEKLVFDWEFLKATAAAGKIADLQEEVSNAEAVHIQGGAKSARSKILRDALVPDARFVQENTERIFEIVWNYGHWLDSEALAPHLVGGSTHSGTASLENVRTTDDYRKWLEHWHSIMVKAERPWLELLRPPPNLHLDDPPLRHLLDWEATSLAWFSDRNIIACGTDMGTIFVLDAINGTQLFPPIQTGALDAVKGISILPEGNRLAAASMNGILRLLDLETGNIHYDMKIIDGMLFGLAADPRRGLCVAYGDQIIPTVINMENGHVIRQLPGLHKHKLGAAAFSQDGNLLATGDRSGIIGIWDHASGRMLHKIRINDTVPQQSIKNDLTNGAIRILNQSNAGVKGLAFAANGCQLISCSIDGTIKFWDTCHGSCIDTVQVGQRIFSLALSPDNAWMAVMSEGASALIYSMRAPQKVLARFPLGDSHFICAYSQDSSNLAVACKTAVTVIQMPPKSASVEIVGHKSKVNSTCFSWDGTLAASADLAGYVRLWQTSDGTCIATCHPHRRGPVPGLAFSPDGHRLATGAHDGQVVVLDIHTLNEIVKYDIQTEVSCLNFSCNGTQLACGLYGGDILLLSTQSKLCARHWKTRWKIPSCICFSPDGTELAVSSGTEQNVLVFRLNQDEPVENLNGPGALSQVINHPEGNRYPYLIRWCGGSLPARPFQLQCRGGKSFVKRTNAKDKLA
ncbi:MAG: DUF4062 domain-containing protein, partial [bacterium]